MWAGSVQARSRRDAAEHDDAAAAADRAAAAPARRRRQRTGARAAGERRQEAAHGLHRDPATHAGRHLQGDKAPEQGDPGDDCRTARPQGVDGRQLLYERAPALRRQVHGRDAVVVGWRRRRRPGQQHGARPRRRRLRHRPTVTAARPARRAL